jgi:hypothetical protein
MKTFYTAIAINGALKVAQCKECEIPGRMERYTKDILRDYLNNIQVDNVMNGSKEFNYFISRNVGQITISKRVEEVNVGYLFNSKQSRDEVFAAVYGGELVTEMPAPAAIVKPVTSLRDQFMAELTGEIKRRAPDM